MKNYFIEKSRGFKDDKISSVLRVFEIFKVTSIFFKLNYIFLFIVSRKNI